MRSRRNRDSGLCQAVGDGDLALVKLRVAQGADLAKEGDFCMSHAAEFGNVPIAAYLLEQGVAPVNNDDPMQCPARLAIRHGCFEIIGLFAKCGVDFSKIDDVLQRAAESVYPAVIEALLEHGVGAEKGGARALYVAARYGRLSSVVALLSRGINPLILHESTSSEFWGYERRGLKVPEETARDVAATNGHGAVVAAIDAHLALHALSARVTETIDRAPAPAPAPAGTKRSPP